MCPEGRRVLDEYRKWGTLAYSQVFLLPEAIGKGEPSPFEAPLIEWMGFGHSSLSDHS